MEPGRDGREERAYRDPVSGHYYAAMEPGRDGREELYTGANLEGANLAAMEPGRDGREESMHGWQRGTGVLRPQWSPAVMAGRSRRRPGTPE